MESQRPIDPGAEPSLPKASKTDELIAYIRRWPACTLQGGEGKLLVDRIDELTRSRDSYMDT